MSNEQVVNVANQVQAAIKYAAALDFDKHLCLLRLNACK
jgi:hypothetical protein